MQTKPMVSILCIALALPVYATGTEERNQDIPVDGETPQAGPAPIETQSGTKGKTSGKKQTEPSDAAKAQKNKGLFRGDWGKTLNYQKDDKVNTDEASSFISLKDDNRDHPPDTSPDYWKLLKKGDLPDPATCAKLGAGAKLARCDMRAIATLKGAQLAGADLSKSKLSGELTGADLTGANLSGAAVFGGLNLGSGTKLRKSNLSGLQAGPGNRLEGEGADLSEANLSKASLYGANLKCARMDKATLKGADLTGATLDSASFEGADLAGSNLSFANLKSGRLAGAAMNGSDLTESELAYADLGNTKLRGATLAGSNLEGVNLAGADLSGANLESARGADSAHIDSHTNFSSAVCPDGVTVDGTSVTTCVGHGF